MATITTRAGKGSPLTNSEVDSNFTNINTELGQKESASNKGVANGYASLDGSGKVPSTQLPSYVDDVVEGANLAALPGTGETGKIYVTLDTNKTYRWSGSAYVEISASPGSTDAVPEGSTNLYFSNTRARSAVSATGSLSYNSSTGVMSFTDAVTSVAGRTGAVTLTSSDVGLGNVENKSSSTIRGEITSGNVTTALGYTPANSTSLSSYLPLSGGTLTGELYAPNLTVGGLGRSSFNAIGGNIGSTAGSWNNSQLELKNTDGGTVALSFHRAGVSSHTIEVRDGSGLRINGDFILHAGNYNSYALPLSGGTLTGVTLVKRNLGTNDYTNVGQHNLHLRLQRSSDLKTLELGVLDNGTGVIQANEAGVGYNTLALNPVSGAVTVNGNQVLHAGNYSSYSPSLTGGGASGTWGINITGNANTASLAIWSNQYNFSTSGAGWYRVATTGSDGRGTYNVELYCTGGSHNPSLLQICAQGDWGYDKIVYANWDGNFPASAVRITRGASNTFLEVYFTVAIAGATLRINRSGFDTSITPYTGSLPGGGDTVKDTLDVTAKINASTLSVSNSATAIRLASGHHIGMGDWGLRNTTPYGWIQFGPANSSWCHIYGSQAFYFNQDLYTNGAIQLHSSNYSSYAPTLTGGGASGTWGINVTGTAGSISGYNNPTTAATANTIVYRDGSGHISGNYIFGSYFNSSAGNSENPTIGQVWTQSTGDNYLRKSTPSHFIAQLGLMHYAGLYSGNWQNLTNTAGQLRVDQVNNINDGNHSNQPPSVYTYGGVMSWRTLNHSFQLYASHTGDLTFKTQWGNDNYSGWRRILHESNYNSFAPTLTGGGASGTWGINITGNAAGATTLFLQSLGSGSVNVNNGHTGVYRTDTGNGSAVNYAPVLHVGGGDTMWQAQGTYGTSGSGTFYFRQGYNGSWGNWLTMLSSANYSSYALPLSGGTLTGVVNATDFRSQGQIRATGWYNVNSGTYTGLGTEIGVSGGGSYILSYNRDTGSYGTLEFNAANIRLVPIGGSLTGPSGNAILHAGNYNSYSPTLTGGGASGTWGISITGNAGTVGGLSVHGGTNNEANKIVRTDGNGYIQAGWINTISGNLGSGSRLNRVWCSDDQYMRYLTLAEFKMQMGLSAKNSFQRHIDYTGDQNYWVGSFGGSGLGANETFHGGSGFIDLWNGTNFPPSTSHVMGFNALHYTTNSFGSTGGNAYGIQVVGQYDQGGLLFSRGCSGGTFSGWRRQIDDNNYNNYSPTLTGGGASGTWGISITGNSDTVDGLHASSFTRKDTTNQYLKPYYEYGSYLTSETPSTLASQMGGGGLRVDFLHPSYTGSGGWNHVITWSGYNVYNMYQLGGHYDGGTGTDLWVRSEANHGGSSWTAWRKLLNSSNYNSYSPTLTGGGASGTWGINITGSASSASTASSASSANAIGSTGYGSTQFTWRQDSGTFAGYSGWASYMINSHGNGVDYYNQTLIMPFWGAPQYSRLEGGTFRGPYTFLTTENYTSYSPSLTGSGASGTWSINISGSAAQLNGYSSAENGGSVILRTQSNGYLNFQSWINVGGSGLYSSTANGSHFYPNNGSYGSWRVAGSRNGWSGIEFDASNTQVSLMCNADGNTVGWHANSYGWKYRWASGTLYIHKGSYGGGTEAVALDSSNYSSYALPLSGGTMTGTLTMNGVPNSQAIYFNDSTKAIYLSSYWLILKAHANEGIKFRNNSDVDVFYINHGTSNYDAWFKGNVTAYSDERVKSNWRSFDDGFVERLASVKSGTFDRLDYTGRQAGVSAQSMREVIPEAVTEGSDGMLAVAYGNAAMVSAVELAKELVQLKRELAELKSKLH